MCGLATNGGCKYLLASIMQSSTMVNTSTIVQLDHQPDKRVIHASVVRDPPPPIKRVKEGVHVINTHIRFQDGGRGCLYKLSYLQNEGCSYIIHSYLGVVVIIIQIGLSL